MNLKDMCQIYEWFFGLDKAKRSAIYSMFSDNPFAEVYGTTILSPTFLSFLSDLKNNPDLFSHID